jgi:hypothetical protein
LDVKRPTRRSARFDVRAHRKRFGERFGPVDFRWDFISVAEAANAPRLPASSFDGKFPKMRRDRPATMFCQNRRPKRNRFHPEALTGGMQARRFTRLTNAFSKKLANLKGQVALNFARYNSVKIHRTFRCTPAMEAGLTDHLWSIEELLESQIAWRAA